MYGWYRALLFVLLFSLACDEEECPIGPTNSPPVVDRVAASPSFVTPGDTVSVYVIAHDPNDNAMTYEWRATAGSIAEGQNDSAAAWISPLTVTTETLTVTVSDGEESVRGELLIGVGIGLPADWIAFGLPADPLYGRMDHGGVYDPLFDRMIIVGGRCTKTVRSLDLVSMEWTTLNTGSAGPLGTEVPAVVFDKARQRLVYFGGWECGAGGSSDELWTLDLSYGETGEWTKHESSGGPSPRNGMAYAYDEVGDRMILFGGDVGTSSSFQGTNDVWQLELGTLTWNEIVTTGEAPSPRWFATAIVDPLAYDLVVFGGWPGEGELYRLDLETASWTQITPQGDVPPPTEGHAAVLDGDLNCMIVYGGLLLHGSGAASRSEIWGLDLATDEWERVTMRGYRPVGSWGVSGVWADGRILFFGGIHTTEVGDFYANGVVQSDGFALQYAAWKR